MTQISWIRGVRRKERTYNIGTRFERNEEALYGEEKSGEDDRSTLQRTYKSIRCIMVWKERVMIEAEERNEAGTSKDGRGD